MPNTIKFIDSVIRNLQATEKRQTFWCIGCPGFGIRINPSSSKVFIFKYMGGEKKNISRWISIGKYPEWSIRRARQESDKLYEQVHEYGRDPVKEKKKEERKKKETPTVSEFIEIYLEYAKLRGKASLREEERVFRLDLIPLVGKKNICNVTPDDIDGMQTRILKRAQSSPSATRKGHVAVKNSLAYARILFNYAKRKHLIEINPVTEVESLGKSIPRSRVLSFEEIWTFWNRIETVGVPPVTARALKFLLVTMQRSNEVRNLRYASLKLGESVWQMERHETKNRTMHRVPLNRHALELIQEVESFTSASKYIFGATRLFDPPKNRNPDLIPLGNTALTQAIRKKRKVLGIPDFRPHDLRRTGATWITAVGLPKLYARLMLNHSDGERDVTGEVYVQYSYDFEKQRAAKVWEFTLDQIVACNALKEIPTLEELRKRVKETGLL
jgi:integrase